MGNAFALLQIKAILAILLRRYEFELVNPHVESDFHGLVVGPKNPCRARYRRRAVPATARSQAGQAGKAASVAVGPAPRRYRVSVDLDLCQSHGACVAEAPEVFHVDGLGKVKLLDPTPDAALSTKVETAARFCPTGTIRIEPVTTGETPKCPV